MPRQHRTDPAEVEACLHLPIQALGLPAPPTDAILSLRARDPGFRATVNVPDGELSTVLSWLDQHVPFQRDETTYIDPSTAAVRCQDPPAAWRTMLSTFRVPDLKLTAGGVAKLTLVGSRDALRAFVKAQRDAEPDDRAEAPPIRLERVGPHVEGEEPHGLLTSRQEEAVKAAADRGYYAVPRELTLRDLAGEMDLSAGALSELLRRAEARLIQAYLESRLTGEPGADQVPYEPQDQAEA